MALNADPDRFVLSLGPPPSQSDSPAGTPLQDDDSRTRAFTLNYHNFESLSHLSSLFNFNFNFPLKHVRDGNHPVDI